MHIYDRGKKVAPAGREEVTALVGSELVVKNMLGPPRRGFVQSAFPAAANLLFSDGFWLSLNALPSSFPGEIHEQRAGDAREGYATTSLDAVEASDARKGYRYVHGDSGNSVDFLSGEYFLPLMPNGLLLGMRTGAWPFAELRAGMPVVLGAGRLMIEAISCSLDGSGCRRWNPRIAHPECLDGEQIRVNTAWLARFCRQHHPPAAEILPEYEEGASIRALAEHLCGRGRGLTPAGDDFLAGWMAAGWLLNGSQPAFLADCQRIIEIAEQRTHALSRCWLAHAADGAVAHPIGTLLTALTTSDHARLAHAAAHTLALGATSGYDLLRGILYGLIQFAPDQVDNTLSSSITLQNRGIHDDND